MYVSDFVAGARARLGKLYPPAEAAAIVTELCRELLDIHPSDLLCHPEAVVEGERMERLLSAEERLCSGEPLQYVTGRAWFYGRRFDVNSSVLIPRSETELLCRRVVDEIGLKARAFCQCDRTFPKILDLCTGSGCIAWTLAMELPGAEVYAVDVSEAALKTASSQPFAGLSDGAGPQLITPHFIHADVLNPDYLRASLPEGIRFDAVVSNPPYVLQAEKALMRPNVLEHEPQLALFVPEGREQIFNAAIADICVEFLHTDGFGIVEINEALGGPAAAQFAASGLRDVALMQDFSGRDRFVTFLR